MKNILLILVLFLGGWAQPSYAIAPAKAKIESIRGRLVKVRVPSGMGHVTLQVLTSPATAKTGATWKTVFTKALNGEPKLISMVLPASMVGRSLRVLGAKKIEVPENFLTGITNFLGDPVGRTGGVATGIQSVTGGTLNLGVTAFSSLASADFSKTVAPMRSVVESDIWKRVGDRLYFFNQLRGLQVFDVSRPEAPALLGTLRMPAVGEQMYVLESGPVVLLKQATNSFWDDWSWGGGFVPLGGGMINFGGAVLRTAGTTDSMLPTSVTLSATLSGSVTLSGTQSVSSNLTLGSTQLVSSGVLSLRSASPNLFFAAPYRVAGENEVVIADVANGQPRIIARVPFQGTLRESRMVGNVLYVAADRYWDATSDQPYAQWGCELTSFDLSDPSAPVLRDRLRLGGWASAVLATNQFLFVTKWADNSSRNDVQIVDISSPDGTMHRAGDAFVDGYVTDKFKLNVEGNVLTVISSGGHYTDATGAVSNPWGYGSVWTPFTLLSTFSLADALNPAALGQLAIAPGETVRATRFDHDRAYVVTFLQIDPLWVIDLKDPANPVAAGHVEAPGFSTYIEPLGDRLVTIGLVNWQPTVSLFDVSEPSAPKLLTQISLNDPSGWNYSEAVWDEKAFNVIPEENLVLLPLSGYSSEAGSFSRVQLIDLLEDKLVKRGIVEADFQPRRSLVQAGNILSIAPTKLVSVDASDRDLPKLLAEVEIAWTVDRNFVVGDYLIELEGNEWSSKVSLTVTPSSNPDESLTNLDLPTAGALVGASVQANVLYVLQWKDDSDPSKETSQAQLLLSTFDLGALPALQQIGSSQTSAVANDVGWWGNRTFSPLWINPDTLVWEGAGTSNSWWQPVWYDAPPYEVYQWEWEANTAKLDANDTDGSWNYKDTGTTYDPPGTWLSRWVYSQSKRYYAFNVAVPAAPAFASFLELGKGKPWELSAGFVGAGNLFVSHKHLGNLNGTAERQVESKNLKAPGAVPDALINRHFLELVDYTDPAHPAVDGQEASLPGQLVGVSRGGALLYTMGQNLHAESGAVDPAGMALHASAFDGSKVHLLDAIPITSEGQPFALSGETAFLLKPEPPKVWTTAATGNSSSWEPNPVQSQLTTWQVDADGKFKRLGGIDVGHENNLSLFGSLAVVHGGESRGGYFLSWGWNVRGWTGGNSRTLHLIDASVPSALLNCGTYVFDGAIYPNLKYADGSLQGGLWVPLGAYGVERVPLKVDDKN